MRNDLEIQLDRLLRDIIDMGERTDAMLSQALEGLRLCDASVTDHVVAADREVDELYEQVQHGVVTAVALHGPVAGDLRLLTAMLHVSLHVERVGDYAVGVARSVRRACELPADPTLTGQLVEMGNRARDVTRSALETFVRRDADAARDAARLDDDVDRLHVGIFQRLVRLAAGDEAHLEWATHMIQLARHLERLADHGVDIAEQTVFMVTGVNVELSSNDLPARPA